MHAAIEQRAAFALLMLLTCSLARLNEMLERAKTEQEFMGLGSKFLSRPRHFYRFLLAAEWKQIEAILASPSS